MTTVLWLFSKALNLLPRPLVMGLGTAMGYAWFYMFRFRRDVILENLRRVYGQEKTEKQIQQLALANCVHYGKNALEFILSLSWTEKEGRKIPMYGEKHLVEALSQEQGCFLLSFHLGPWENGIHAITSRGLPLDVIVKRAKSKWAEKILFWHRSKTGATPLPETRTVGEILKSLSKNRIVAFLLDQFMGPPIGLPVTFFGKQAGTAVGLALLMEKRPAPVVLFYSLRDSHDRPYCVAHAPIHWENLPEDKNERLYYRTQVFNDLIEEVVRKHPEQWLWIHRRWKEFRGQPKWLRPLISAPLAPTLAILMMAFPMNGFAAKTKAPVKTETKTVEKTAEKATDKIPAENLSLEAPFEIGERQVVDLDWMNIPAGRVTLEVKEGVEKEAGERPVFEFWGKVRSSLIVDALYKIDNTIQSFVDKASFLPYRFYLLMDEKMQYKETRVTFDHRKNIAHYWADRKSERWGNERQDRLDAFQPKAQDMFSAIYAARMREFQLNTPQDILVYENGKNLKVQMNPVATEVLRTPAGLFPTTKIQVTLHIDNVLKPSGDVFLWLSDDSKKYIVKFDAKLKIGALRGTLVELRDNLLSSNSTAKK